MVSICLRAISCSFLWIVECKYSLKSVLSTLRLIKSFKSECIRADWLALSELPLPPAFSRYDPLNSAKFFFNSFVIYLWRVSVYSLNFFCCSLLNYSCLSIYSWLFSNNSWIDFFSVYVLSIYFLRSISANLSLFLDRFSSNYRIIRLFVSILFSNCIIFSSNLAISGITLVYRSLRSSYSENLCKCLQIRSPSYFDNLDPSSFSKLNNLRCSY